MSITVILAVALATIAGLFAIARYGEKADRPIWQGRRRAVIYGLSLGVYFTSWTFYGAVGSASMTGWDYLPIYLGPFLAFTIGYPIVRRLVRAGREDGSASIADFLSHRYGKSSAVAAVVSLIAVAGALPYIALQLHSIRVAFEAAGGMPPGASGPLAGAVIAGALAVFAVLFGARSADMTARNRGLVLAIAGETVLKLFALLAIAVFAVLMVIDTGDIHRSASPLYTPPDMLRFAVITGLAFTAVLCLPRQFQMMVVECQDDGDLITGRSVFLAALAITALVVPPIAIAGLPLVTAGAAPDTLVLALPMARGAEFLSLLVIAGGVAAAIGMVIVSTLALSIMVTNDHITAARLRLSGARDVQSARQQLNLRRVVISAIVCAAWIFSEGVTRGETLASLGLLAFAAAAQFSPTLIGGLYWRRANRVGALTGMSLGFAAWVILLALPAYSAIQPLIALPGMGTFESGTLLALSLNITGFILGTVLSADAMEDQMQARKVALPAFKTLSRAARVADLKAVVLHTLGDEEGAAAFAAYELAHGKRLADRDMVDDQLMRFSERQIARVLGSASARVVLSAILSGDRKNAADMTLLVGEARERLRFSHDLLEATLDNMSQGVSVIDKDLNMVAWNRAYLDLFDYPKGYIRPNIPVAEIIRFNAERGLAGADTVDTYVDRRIGHYRAGTAYKFERLWTEGRTISIEGNPLPGGGYVTTFTDVTEAKKAEAALKETADALERRVEERTAALRSLNAELSQARHVAEAATQSKTRFLAAASHDLMQPLNAARLFASALDGHVDQKATSLLPKLDQSIANADRLIRTLLNISKLDAGGLTPDFTAFPLQDLLHDLADEFEILAEEKGLALTVMPTSLWVMSDRGLLQSVLQNFLSNAIRYTSSGRILLGARPRGSRLEIQVIDTGPGIPLHERKRIFDEFARGSGAEGKEKGLGLGLAITKRISNLLQSPIRLDGTRGRGSLFSITVDQTNALDEGDTAEAKTVLPDIRDTALAGRRVLCVDNDQHILDGEQALLERWGCEVLMARSTQEALSLYPMKDKGPDLMLLDYHLDDGETGLDVYGHLSDHLGRVPPALLLTGDRTAATMDALPVLTKPIDPGTLKAEMKRLLS